MKQHLASNLKHLRKTKGLTQAQMAEALGTKRATVGAWEEGRAEPRARMLQTLSAYFQVSLDALLLTAMDDAAQTRRSNTPSPRVLPIAVDREAGEELITVVPVRAAAGYLSGYGDVEFIASLPTFRLPVSELPQDMTLRLFQIEGDSMLPLPSGSYVLASYLEQIESAGNREPFIAVTQNDGIVFKRIENRLKQQGLWHMISDNPEFHPFDVPQEEVLELWKARAFISFELNPPLSAVAISNGLQEIAQRLDELSEKLPK